MIKARVRVRVRVRIGVRKREFGLRLGLASEGGVGFDFQVPKNGRLDELRFVNYTDPPRVIPWAMRVGVTVSSGDRGGMPRTFEWWPRLWLDLGLVSGAHFWKVVEVPSCFNSQICL